MKIKIISLTLGFVVVFCQPANAFFGSECKKPKASYENYRKEFANLQPQIVTQKTANKERLVKAIASCKADYKSYAFANKRTEVITSKSKCGMLPLFDEFLSVPAEFAAYLANKNSYQVILNNQKCFSPELVIEAQRALKVIK